MKQTKFFQKKEKVNKSKKNQKKDNTEKTAKEKTKTELKKEYAQYTSEKEATNRLLNQAYVSDRAFVKNSRQYRTGRRAARRQ